MPSTVGFVASGNVNEWLVRDDLATLLAVGSDSVLIIDAYVAAGGVNPYRAAQLAVAQSADLLLSAGGV